MDQPHKFAAIYRGALEIPKIQFYTDFPYLLAQVGSQMGW